MRRPALLTVLLLLPVFWTCDGTSPTGPDDTRPEFARGSAATVVPIHAEAEVAPDPEAGLIPCVLEGTTDVVAAFPALHLSEGEISHLGHTTSRIWLTTCTVHFDGSLSGPGWGVHTAANGDELEASWFGTFYPGGAFDLNWIEFAGGTGRFADAVGQAAGGGAVDEETGAGTWWFEGTISRVGAK